MEANASASKTISIEQLAGILHRSVATLRSDMVRNPASLPPSFKCPGSRRPLWLAATVSAFVEDLARKAGAHPEDISGLMVIDRVGNSTRPRSRAA